MSSPSLVEKKILKIFKPLKFDKSSPSRLIIECITCGLLPRAKKGHFASLVAMQVLGLRLLLVLE